MRSVPTAASASRMTWPAPMASHSTSPAKGSQQRPDTMPLGYRKRSVAGPWLLPALLLIASCKILVPPAAPDSPLLLAIVDVTIVDVVAGSLQPHGTVVVADG